MSPLATTASSISTSTPSTLGSPAPAQNNFDYNGFYWVEPSEDGQGITLQVQTKANQGYNGALLGCLFVELTQVGDDVYGQVANMKYLYGSNYGVDGRKKGSSNTTRYYDASENMSSGHAVFNFSLQDFVLVAKDTSTIGETRTVTVLDKDGEVFTTFTLAPNVADATDRMPSAADMAVDGFVFVGWDHDVASILKDATVAPVYHRLCTVNFLDRNGAVYRQVADVEESVPMDAEDIPDGAEEPGYVFKNWAVDLSTTPVAADENGVLVVESVYHRLCTVNYLNRDDTLYRQVADVEEGVVMDAAAIPEGPVLTGFVFKGWSVDLSKTAVAGDENGNVVVRPVYHRLCTVNFLDRDGAIYQQVLGVEEETVMAASDIPEGPAVAGYHFDGWEIDLSKTAVAADDNGLLQVHPLYSRCHVVTFLGYGGVVLDTQFVPDGHAATPPDLSGSMVGKMTFMGWDVDFSAVTSDLQVRAQYVMLELIPADVEYPVAEEEQVLFTGIDISKVLGIELEVFYRYSTGSGTRGQGVYRSSDPPVADGNHQGTGFYDYTVGDGTITFEFRGINSTGSYNWLASAFKWTLWQDGDDIRGKKVWFKAGGNASLYMDRQSWDNVGLLYDFGFHMNDDGANYTAKILNFSLILRKGDPTTVILFQ